MFPYVFNPPVNWWNQNTAKIRFLGQQVGGMEQLKGVKIAHVYHDSDYGRDTISILDAQAAQYGFAIQHLAVPHPGLGRVSDTHFPTLHVMLMPSSAREPYGAHS